jgi:hypothetical protein
MNNNPPVPTIIEDDREIKTIFKDWFLIKVGENGVTKIVPYQESGQMSMVTWFAVYKGDFLQTRIDSTGLGIEYKEED